MTSLPPTPELRVAVIGAGLMGHGIARVFAGGGCDVVVFDPSQQALDSLGPRIEADLEPDEDRCLIDRINTSGTLPEAVAGADLVVEAAPEELELKQGIFRELDEITPDSTILATNTSVMPVGEIARETERPGRIVGTHWWNPPHLVPLVEVIEAEQTSPATVEQITRVLADLGKQPVHVRRDIPGFVGNRLQHAMWREAFRLIDRGVCDPETIDTVVKSGFGPRLAVLGPVENADLIGLDLTESIHRHILPELDRSTEPSEALREAVARGERGAKDGSGFLDWPSGAAAETRRRLARHLRRNQANSELNERDNRAQIEAQEERA